MPVLRTRCPLHSHFGRGHKAGCAACVQAVANYTALRKRKLERLKQERLERQAKAEERESKRAYRAMLAALKSKKRAARVRWVKDADGRLLCSKHGEPLAPHKNKQRKKPSHYCRACSRERARRAAPKRAELKRQKKHDAQFGTLHSIRSPLAHLIKTGIAPNAEHARKRS